jgi:hypothetical protein
MKSTFLPTGMGYVYKVGDDFDPELLTIEVTNLRQRAGSSYALLTTSTNIASARRIPGTNRVLNAEVWLLSERSRADYAGSLARLIPAPAGAKALDFGAILEEMAQRVIEQENAPVEVTRLTKAIARQTVPFLIEDILPAKKPTILYGAGGVGKSILAATMAVCVQTGTKFLGKQVQQAEVLYLDWETDEEDIASRVEVVAAGLGLGSAPNLRYSSLVRPIEDRVSALARYVAEEHIGFVIIDSVGMAMSAARDGGDVSETAIRFFRALRALDAAVLAIDHVSGDDMRRGRAGASKPYGSVYKWNSARNAYELRERREPDAKGAHLTLKHRKSNIGSRQPDLHLAALWTEVAVTFIPESVVPVLVMPVAEQILDVLATGPATPRQIADLLSNDDNQYHEIDVRREVKTLMGKRQVTANADGTIRLVPVDNPVVDSSQLLPD